MSLLTTLHSKFTACAKSKEKAPEESASALLGSAGSTAADNTPKSATMWNKAMQERVAAREFTLKR